MDMDKDDIIHIGGYGSSWFSAIDRVSTISGASTRVNELPQAVNGIHAAWDRENGVAYIFGGYNGAYQSSIVMFNASNDAVSQVGQLPEARGWAATAWDSQRELAYIFGAWETSTGRDILTFDPASGAVTKLTSRLPYAMQQPIAVYVEHNGHAIVIDTAGLVLFDPISQIAEPVPVDGWPRSLNRPACVYVPKLARIYIFGGQGSYSGESTRYRDEISYISFTTDEGSTTTMEPPTDSPTVEPTTEQITFPPNTTEPPHTTEAPFCPPTGVHNFPYPGNCTLYIRCFDGVEAVLSCAPLLFDKIDLVCKPPSEAVCDEEIPIQCPPTGYETQPHPSSCSKYYECNNGNAYESECAPSTYFDTTPELMHCNLAHLAVCNSECPPTGITFIPIRARECKWYKVCIEGNSANLECGSGEVYSPVESKCVPADEYMCPYAAGEAESDAEEPRP